MALTVGSLFAGIGGFDLGFERAGFVTRWQVEINPDARDVLARRFPEARRVTNIEYVSQGRAKNRQRHGLILEPVDVICGGFPCQELSVAGQRRGLKGKRSGLFFRMARVIAQVKPRYVVIENVPGLLSSHDGRDFATVLDRLAECGYGWAYRVLDSRYFGVAQRRRRVFIVGCLGDDYERAAAVLFEPEGSSGDSAAGDEARAHVAATLRSRAHGAGSHAPGRGSEDDENLVAYALRADPGGIGQGHNTNYVTSALTASAGHHGYSSPRGDGSDNLIAFNWQTGQEQEQFSSECAPTLHQGQTPAVFGVHANQRGELRTSDLAGSLNGSRSGSGERERALTASMHKRHDEDTDTLIGHQTGVRRLTPLECERLQGFPDGWTCRCGEGHRGSAFCQCADSPRYRMLGNAVTVNVSEWIAKRIAHLQRGEAA